MPTLCKAVNGSCMRFSGERVLLDGDTMQD
jgi:hypothetical protein